MEANQLDDVQAYEAAVLVFKRWAAFPEVMDAVREFFKEATEVKHFDDIHIMDLEKRLFEIVEGRLVKTWQ